MGVWEVKYIVYYVVKFCRNATVKPVNRSTASFLTCDVILQLRADKCIISGGQKEQDISEFKVTFPEFPRLCIIQVCCVCVNDSVEKLLDECRFLVCFSL